MVEFVGRKSSQFAEILKLLLLTQDFTWAKQSMVDLGRSGSAEGLLEWSLFRLRRHRLHRFHLGRHQHAHYFIPQHSPPCRHLPPEKRGPCELEFDKEEVKKWSADVLSNSSS